MDTNTGDHNSGLFNAGNHNSGNWNTGISNTGASNSGDHNSGNLNSGNYNSGSLNSGDWNSGDYNSGIFNSNEPKLRIFNKETYLSAYEIEYPDFVLNFELHPNKTYKESWEYFWNDRTENDIELLFNMPNFDPDIFKEITGIYTNDLYLKWKENN